PYHEQGAYDIEGPLDATALRRAWEAVVARHAILRSRFAWEGLDRPQQIVEHAVALPWDEEDWSPLAADEERRLLAERLAEDKGRGFDLGSAPLMRLRLCRLAASRSLLVWSFHHALLDGWSVPLLWAEVWERYRSLRDGAPTTSDAPFVYREYITWLAAQAGAASEAFWRRELLGVRPTPLPGATDEGGSAATEEPRIASERLVAIDEETTRGLTALGRRHGLTLNTLVQGAWAILLSRHGGE